MAVIYLNLRGSPTAGGPGIFCHKLAPELIRRGHKVIYDSPEKASVALCIIESGKLLRKVDRSKTKIIVRLDGAYFKEYWHSQTPDRMWRDDMTALHAAIKRDVAAADFMVYQSLFSKTLIDNEIAPRTNNFEIINNGSDPGVFDFRPRPADGFVNLLSVGKMRNAYFMESLVYSYKILAAKGIKVRLLLAGTMDSECGAVYNASKQDPNIIHLGSFPNTQLAQVYSRGDIFLAPRQGSSSDNTISEAQLSGLPCVVPSWGGNAEMVADRQSGIIVSTGHWDYGEGFNLKMAGAVEEIIKDLADYQQRARAHALKELTLDKMVGKYINIMEKL